MINKKDDITQLERYFTCGEEASNIFCFHQYDSCARSLVDMMLSLGACKAFVINSGDGDKMHCMNGMRGIDIYVDSLVEYLPLLFTESECVLLSEKESRGFLTELGETVTGPLLGVFFACEVQDKESAFFVSFYEEADAETAIELGSISEKYFKQLISSVVFSHQGEQLQSQLSSSQNRQTIWLESLAWMNQASRDLETRGNRRFLHEAIFQLSVMVKAEQCALHRISVKTHESQCNDEKMASDNQKPVVIKPIINLKSDEFESVIQRLVNDGVQFEKNSFTHINQSSENFRTADNLKQIALYPLYIENAVAMLVSIGKSESCFEKNEIVFAGLFCEGIQSSLDRRFLISSIREQNVKLEKDKHTLQALNQQLRKTQETLLQKEKLASVGQLAAGVSHEINNPLGYVNSNIDNIRDYFKKLFALLHDTRKMMSDEGPVVRTDVSVEESEQAMTKFHDLCEEYEVDFMEDDSHLLIQETRDGLNRVERIVSSLSNLSKEQEGQLNWVKTDVEDSIDLTLELISSDIKNSVDIVKQYEGIPAVFCIPSQLKQLTLNLLMNAFQAMPDGGCVTIRTFQKDAQHIAFEIRDSGVGVAPSDMGKIFEPFYTTKPFGSATGLGLWSSFNIAQAHNGQITSESELNEGAVFTVTLPISQRGTSPCLDHEEAPLMAQIQEAAV